jgi:hypothetical protein
MALLPLLWLGVLASYGQRRSALWWTLAVVIGVSWLADTAAHRVDPWIVSTTYPALQALALAVVVLPTAALWRYVEVLIITAVIALLLTGVGRPDVFLRTVAWMGLLVMAWPYRQLRVTMLTTFGLGWLGWVAYSIAPGWTTWGAYQGIRAAGLGVFCWATAPARVRA